MWICLNNAFLSIVSKDCTPDCLLVRARRRGDIETVFPSTKGKVRRTVGNDYLYRAEVPRSEVGAALAAQAQSIDYDNFKNSVKNRSLHDAYAAVWHNISALQEIAPYSRGEPMRRVARSQFDLP